MMTVKYISRAESGQKHQFGMDRNAAPQWRHLGGEAKPLTNVSGYRPLFRKPIKVELFLSIF
jgi:hypothetical protein